jgi:hypothetical protein
MHIRKFKDAITEQIFEKDIDTPWEDRVFFYAHDYPNVWKKFTARKGLVEVLAKDGLTSCTYYVILDDDKPGYGDLYFGYSLTSDEFKKFEELYGPRSESTYDYVSNPDSLVSPFYLIQNN